MFIGPLVGAALLFTVGPGPGLFINVALYLPFIIYLWFVPFDGHARRGASERVRLTMRATMQVLAQIPKYPAILTVFVLQGAVGLLIGTTILPLLPEFGELLGQGSSGLGYGALITAMSIGAVTAGIALESIGRVKVGARLAIVSTIVFAGSLLVFALSRNLPLSVAMLVLAGAGNLVSSSTSQAVVQLNAPDDRRGRFIGAFSMVGTGFRVGSGVVVGLLGGLVGPAGAIAIDAALLLAIAATLFVVATRHAHSTP